MTGHLLFIVLIYSFHQIEALPPPKLTVTRSVITEIDSVTLTCEPPSSVPVSQCHFYTLIASKGNLKDFPCVKTLTGIELLDIVNTLAVVKVNCFYEVQTERSEYSDISTITIQSSPPPKLTVDPPVITETDSVTLRCEPPSSVSVSQCHFYTVSGGTARVFPCLKTLTGSELLQMASLTSPAEVKVRCCYTVKHQSPYSVISYITVQRPNGDKDRITDLTTSTPSKKSPAGRDEADSTAAMPHNTVSSTTSASQTTVNPASDTSRRVMVVIMTACGVAVGVVLLGIGLVWNQQREEKCASKGAKVSITDDWKSLVDYDETYSIVNYECKNE
ncbi:uncharacterized protein LOC125006376 isoform X1 [Mugil cephalus]|uniref:uncharacterized protein LOC125006376 isoform X1 n=1 Tax=Mugil cephalus TaxID=48193 RepID=UPI001FB7C774|nr:uncharacterized protein LOC125006376 isoform X1 [Mugil cephalus]